MKATILTDRGVVKVAGIDARKFLNGLVTTDMGEVTASNPGFAALLTPQGKIIVDFIIAESDFADGDEFYLDCPRALRHHAGRKDLLLNTAERCVSVQATGLAVLSASRIYRARLGIVLLSGCKLHLDFGFHVRASIEHHQPVHLHPGDIP